MREPRTGCRVFWFLAYNSGTKQASQMLTVLEAILPYFCGTLCKEKSSVSKVIRETIHQLNVTMTALVNNCDELTKYVPRIFLNKEGQPDLSSSVFLCCHALYSRWILLGTKNAVPFLLSSEHVSFWAFSKSLMQLERRQSIIILIPSHKLQDWQSSDSHLAVVWQSSDSRLLVIWQSSGSRLAVVWQSSDSHLAVVWQLYI